ncbi:MAG: hypothetical protein GY946_13550 [bacterium]|nr:hypothetical protein [bacterium]
MLGPLLSIYHGWNVRPSGHDAPPVIRVTKTPRGYRRVSCWQHTASLARAKIRPSVVETICGFHFEFIDWYLAEHPVQIPLHGAGACFGNRLVLFPALAKAGKSTLSVHLAMAGHTLYSDDVIPIDGVTREAVAMGIQSRLREIPGDASDAFRAFVTERQGPARPGRIYVLLRDHELAPLDQRAPVGGVVLLHRSDDATPSLTPADPADVLETLILQNFSKTVPAPHALDALHAVAQSAACYRLSYARAPQAVEMLEATFGAAS